MNTEDFSSQERADLIDIIDFDMIESIGRDSAELLRHLKPTESELAALVGDSVTHENCPGCPTCEARGRDGVMVPTRTLALLSIYAARAQADDARRLFEAGDREHAARIAAVGLRLLLQASGYCMGLQLSQVGEAQANARSELGKRGAQARHGENRALKQDAFSWLDSHRHEFASMDKAAEALAGKIVPVTFRTARDWVGEWHRLRAIRPAGRA